MIEVRKLIPQVYNQSRDFSVFMGVLQILINEADILSRNLNKLPNESILPPELYTYENLRGYFRFMLKEKGSIESILQAISLSGGKIICKLEEEAENLGLTAWDYQTACRDLESEENKFSDRVDRLVYYYRRIRTTGHLDYLELNVNLKDPGQVDWGLLEKLLYYIKPVNVIVKLRKGELLESTNG